MRTDNLNNGNLDKLLDGLSLLDEQDKDRVIRMVDTLDCADKKVKSTIVSNVPPLKQDISSACTGDKK